MTEQNAAYEKWRSVVGYEGIYDVSDHGCVRRDGHILKPQGPPDDYLRIQLWRSGKPKVYLIHRLVAEAFMGPVPNGMEVNHKDGDKNHNRLVNLEFLTRSENNKHAYRIGLRQTKIEPMIAARRKPRFAIPCACGCGIQIETPDKKGRSRRFVSGHNMKGGNHG